MLTHAARAALYDVAQHPEKQGVNSSSTPTFIEARALSAEQQQLVIEYAHIVPGIARQLVKRFSLPSWIDVEEIESCGYVGLCNAAIAFDSSRGIAFGTFAHYRVRGCIIDGYLRRQTPVALS